MFDSEWPSLTKMTMVRRTKYASKSKREAPQSPGFISISWPRDFAWGFYWVHLYLASDIGSAVPQVD